MADTTRNRTERKLPPTERSLAFALLRAREKVMTPIRAMLSDAGITEQQWRILRVLDEFGPLEASRLAEHACLLLPSQTRIVQTLVEKGLVTRTPHPTDRRRHTVAITAAGLQVIDDNRDKAIQLARNLDAVLGPEGVDELLLKLRNLDRL